MTEAGVRTALRAIAVLIAVLAAIDPAIPVVEATPRPIVVVNATASGFDRARQRVADAIGRPVIARDVTRGRLPCGADEECVIVADGSIDVDWGQRFPAVSMIKTVIENGPNVRMRSISVAGGHASAAGSVRALIDGRAVAGQRTIFRVLDGAAVLGVQAHDWAQADESAAVDIPWWPLDAGARVLRVEAVPVDGEITTIDNHIDAGVFVEAAKVSVLVFDARPSWQSTFVRRALEDDPRFAVAHRSRVAPSLSAGTSAGRLDAATLDQAPLVFIGAPDALTAADVSLLERYVRVRGGTLVLLPERLPSGAAARLFGGSWTEQLASTPQRVDPLRASELLRATNVSPASTVLATSGDQPVIVSVPSGAGRVVVAGAMDAWRYRDVDTGAFDRFWRSLAVEGAAAGEGLTLAFAVRLAQPGARVPFTIRDRRLDAVTASEASVVQRCGDDSAHTVRVWPLGAIGEFAGELSAVTRGACTIEARVGDRQAAASLAIVDQPSLGIDRTLAKLERHVRASRGVVVEPGGESAITGALDATTSSVSRDVSARPMRSAWWMLPFAACLSIEWWLRRRAGLR